MNLLIERSINQEEEVVDHIKIIEVVIKEAPKRWFTNLK